MFRKILELIIAILLPLLGGYIVSNITRDAILQFDAINKPPLTPPSWVFPMVWSVLYFFMGLGSFFVFVKNTKDNARVTGLILYILQLIVNFSWSFVFFVKGNYLMGFLMILLLWLIVYRMSKNYRLISPLAYILTIPYIIWLTYAAYINLGIVIMN